jgi:PE family
MSFVIAAPEFVTAAASDLANVGSTITTANAAAAAPTTGVLAAGADEVSATVATLFDAHGQAYQAISAQTAAFHQQFVQLINSGAGSYAAAEAANASPLQSTQQDLLAAINAPTQAALGRPLIGNGANATAPGGSGGAGGLLWGNGGNGAARAAGHNGGNGGAADFLYGTGGSTAGLRYGVGGIGGTGGSGNFGGQGLVGGTGAILSRMGTGSTGGTGGTGMSQGGNGGEGGIVFGVGGAGGFGATSGGDGGLGGMGGVLFGIGGAGGNGGIGGLL